MEFFLQALVAALLDDVGKEGNTTTNDTSDDNTHKHKCRSDGNALLTLTKSIVTTILVIV